MLTERTYRMIRSRVPRALRTGAASGAEAVGVATSGLRVLPSFVIVGGQRCGTNSLYEYLVDHPAVGRAMPGQEVHFFDTSFDRGLDWYRAHFPTRLWMRAARARTGVEPQTGESSPYYMFHPLAPGRIAATLPEVRIIVLLRNPVDRAISHFHHERSRGHEPLERLSEAIAREPERLAGEAARIVAEPGYRSPAHQRFSYVARGQYADQLATILELFEPGRVLVVVSERLFGEPEAVLAEVQEFLGLPVRLGGEYERHNAGSYRDIDATLRRSLAGRFSGSNERVAAMLGVDPPWD
ncbi:MAG TPA: sulfotransferase domain-containing protein [Actinomycetota bacterium]